MNIVLQLWKQLAGRRNQGGAQGGFGGGLRGQDQLHMPVVRVIKRGPPVEDPAIRDVFGRVPEVLPSDESRAMLIVSPAVQIYRLDPEPVMTFVSVRQSHGISTRGS